MPGLHLPTGGSVSRMRTTAVRLRLRATAESNLQGKQTQLNGISKYEQKKPRAEPRLSLGRRERDFFVLESFPFPLIFNTCSLAI